MDVAQDRGFTELGRRSRTSEASVAMLGDMASYLGTWTSIVAAELIAATTGLGY